MGRKLAIRPLYSRHGLSDECYSCPLAERHQTKIHLEMFIERVQRKLEKMTTDGFIEKVDQPTDWVSSVLVESKPSTEADGESKIRICLDPRDLNGAIKREHFPMPTKEEIATRLHGAKVFSVFDASNGFWQVELDEDSSLLTTFNTPFGRYRWKRMPFGIKSAPEVWQRKMREHIEGLKGVEVIADDIREL